MVTVKNPIFILTLFSALGCGLMAGVFFAFSTFVMKGLGRIPANEGISAMQSINFVVPGSIFGIAFIVTPLICLAAMILNGFQWNGTKSIYIILGGIIYLTTNLLVTLIFNIPLNNSLALISPNSPDSSIFWDSYQIIWTLWNHVRTIGAIAAMTSFIFALLP